MNDMRPVIVPKSDQVSADDFLSGPQTFTIETVDIRPGTEQPVSMFMRGEDRAFRPCKSMSRVLVAAWGPDAKAYVGRSVTLYRDPKVKWGGMEVGGIRISHMSNIKREMVFALTATKGKRAPYSVRPLADAPATVATIDKAAVWAEETIAAINAAQTIADLADVDARTVKAMTKLATDRPDLHEAVKLAMTSRERSLSEDAAYDDEAGTDA